jgi:hypothetical protein
MLLSKWWLVRWLADGTYFFSHPKPPAERDSRTFVNESPSAYVSKLRKRSGKDIWLRAGGELARDSP